jgi:hypothetical protein
MILEATTCIGIPATALWVHRIGVTRLLAVTSAALWAASQAIVAAKERYREVYRQTLEGMK